MNSNCFKTVFSKRHGALVAVGEHASSQGKANGAHGANGAGRAGDPSFGLAQIMRHFLGALTASFALVTLAWAQPALNALPTGGQVAQGAVQFSQSAQQLNINQASDRAAVNWQSFDIGAAAKVNVVQPSAQSVLLNRVGGTAPSQIFGQLSANGRVILVNPNGMVFGRDGSVSASAFTGSTLNISDADFMAGNERYTSDGAAGAIVNRGLIQAAPGGYVALLGASVSNEGRIVAPQGDVYLAAADAVTMPANAVALPIGQSGRIKLELTPASINAAVANQKGGTIVTEGGQVYLQAAAVNAALATIIQSGSIDTTGEQGGAVHVLADGGHIRVDGSIKANSTNGTAGGDIYIGRDKDTNVLAAVGDASGARLESKGGFVETSGKFLNVDGTRVMAKDWLLDPDNIDITGDATAATAGYSKIKASDIVANLNIGTSVTIATSPTASLNQPSYKDTPGTGAGSTVSGDGNILVNAVISKTSGGEASLTLLADNGITVNQEIKSTSDKLNVTMKANGSASGASSQGLLINKSIDANGGAINLEGKTTNSVAAVTVASMAVIQGARVTMVGNSTSGAAIKGTGKVNATAGGVSITGVGNTTGDYAITTNNTIDATGDILISTTSAALHGIAIREKVTSSGGKVELYADVRTSGNGSAMNGNFAIKAKNDVTITGKSNGYYSVNGLGAIESTDGKVTIEATSSASSALRLTNTVKAKGDVLIKGAGGNDSGINTGATTTVTSTDGNIEFIGTTTGSGVGVNFTGTTNINATNGTFKVTAESKSSQGVVFQGNTNINAATYTIDAKSLGGAAGLYHGSGNTTLTSTAGDSSIKGTSETGRGVFGFNGNINLNANNGSSTTFSSGKGEMRLGWGGGVAVNTNGNVTLGSVDPGSVQTPFFSQADTTVNSGTLTIKGKSAGHGVAIQDGSGYSTDILVKNGSSLVIVGESTGSGSGIHLLPVGVANKIEMTGQNAGGQKGSITMTGVSAAGVGISTGSTPITSDGGEIRLKGTGNGANGTGMNLNGLVQSVNGATGGKITIDANTLSLTGGPALLDAGSNGTVNIKTHNNNDILVGAADVRSATPANQKLGIDQAELSLIKAGNLVIGDTASTGNITVSGPATTAAATGDIILKTGGSIAVNAALTVGDAAGAKNLTLDAGGAITNGASGKLTADNLTVKAGSTIGADGAAIKTNVATANLTSAGNQFLVEDNNVSVTAKTTGNGNINITTNNGTMTVGPVNGVSGIDAGTGNVHLKATSGSGEGILMRSDVKGNDITVDATANNGTGLGFYGAGGSFTASGTLNLTGTATGTGNGFYSFGGTHTAQTGINITGTSTNGQGVGFDANAKLTNAAGDIVIKGTANGTNTQGIGLRGSEIINNGKDIKLTAVNGNVFTNDKGDDQSNIYWSLTGPLKNIITNNGTGVVEITAGSIKTDTGAIDGKVLTINQNGNGGVLVKTTGNGNVIAPKITNAGTGNVVIAAGSLKDAGDGSGGQVLNSNSSSVTQTSGKTFIYSGKAADTGVLSNLDSTLGALKIDGTANQNADTNAAFGAGAGISGSTAKAQAIFREKLSFANGTLSDATLTKVYGDESTNNTAAAALLAEAKGALKNDAANSGTNSTVNVGTGNNQILVSKSAIVDSLNSTTALTGGETEGQFSAAGFLKAKTGTYQFAGLTSDKYAVTGLDVGVNVNQRELSGSVSAVSTTYGITAATGSASASGVLAGDNVSTSVSDAVLSGTQFSTSGSLRVGTYTQIASVTVTGPDAVNYTSGTASSFNYVVTPKQMTATATAADKVYDGNTSATLVASGVGIVGTDVVTVQGLIGNFASKNVARDGSGNVVAQEVIITGTGSSLGGTDGANYTLVGTTSVPAASARITPKDLSLAGITAADKVYDGNTTAQLSSANAVLTGLVAGDGVNVSAQNAQGNFVDKNVARGANGQPVAKQVLVSGLALTGADQGNYQLGSSADVAATITPRTVTLTGSRALDKVVDSTTTAQVVPGTLEGLVAGEQLGVNASGEFEDALVGTNKLVNARFALINGSNGLAGNYDLANTTAALRAAIVAFVPGTVDPSTGLPTGTSASRIRFSGSSGAGAATGVSDEPAGAELTEQCSVLNPQLCECEDTKIPGVEMCFAPTQVVSLKD